MTQDEVHDFSLFRLYVGNPDKSSRLIAKRILKDEDFVNRLSTYLSSNKEITPTNAKTKCESGVLYESYRDGSGQLRWRILTYNCGGSSSTIPIGSSTFMVFNRGITSLGGGGGTSGDDYEKPKYEVIKLDDSMPEGTVYSNDSEIERYLLEYQLVQLLQSNPFALIDNCDQLESWIEIAKHTPDSSVINKIKNLDDNYISIISGDWDIQYIKDASGPVVNMDYFPVRITKLPKDPKTGRTYTPEDFYNYVRINLDSFFSGSSTTFSPYNKDELNNWKSSNYIGTIMRFDIPIENKLGIVIGQQDGSVICSDQNERSWTFTTIESPIDHNHPVSGNRQFGIEQNNDGSYTFYTRGVDRIAESTDVFFGDLPTMNSAFEGGDDLWSAFQNNINNFVNSPENNGSAQIMQPEIDRPDWDKIKDVLEGNLPISEIGCN